MSARAVFLDRDGVLNKPVIRDGKPYPPKHLDEFIILPGVKEALCKLGEVGFLLIVATNQPDVGRGLQSRAIVELMHQYLKSQLPLDGIKVCYGDDADWCTCYKPKPGLLLEAAQEWDIDLSKSYMVGDRWRDVGCGRAAGCYTIFVDWGYKENLRYVPDATCHDLMEAAAIILQHSNLR